MLMKKTKFQSKCSNTSPFTLVVQHTNCNASGTLDNTPEPFFVGYGSGNLQWHETDHEEIDSQGGILGLPHVTITENHKSLNQVTW